MVVSGNHVSAAGSAVNVTNFQSLIGLNSNVTVSHNTLMHNARGVKVGANSLTGTVQAYRNALTGNAAFGIFKDPASGGSVIGTCNWWGSKSGPGPVGPGAGDNVSVGVSYSPWLTSPNLDGNCGTKSKDD